MAPPPPPPGASGRFVDPSVRTDEVMYFVTEKVAPNIIYYGRTEDFSSLDGDAVWQIKRFERLGTVERVRYANSGKYNCKWTDRVSYFPAEPAPEPPTGSSTVSIVGTVNVEYPGPLHFVEGSADSTPNTPQTLINNAAPVTGTWKLRRVEVVSRAYAQFELKKGTQVIKVGYTSPTESTISLPIEPWVEILTTDEVDLIYTQTDGPVVPVTARVYYTEHA